MIIHKIKNFIFLYFGYEFEEKNEQSEDWHKKVNIIKHGFYKRTFIEFKKYNSVKDKILAQIDYIDYSKPIYLNDYGLVNEICKSGKNVKFSGVKNKDELMKKLSEYLGLNKKDESEIVHIPIL